MRRITMLTAAALAALLPAAAFAEFTGAPPPAQVAVAADGQGRWGYTITRVGQTVDPSAAALRNCGPGCRIEAKGDATCVAYFESRAGGYWYGVGIGKSAQQVEKTALHGCALGDPAGTCRGLKSTCQ